MATKLPATGIAIIGLGWTGSIIAESMTKAGFNVVAIERRPWRDTATDFPPSYSPDQQRYAVPHDQSRRDNDNNFACCGSARPRAGRQPGGSETADSYWADRNHLRSQQRRPSTTSTGRVSGPNRARRAMAALPRPSAPVPMPPVPPSEALRLAANIDLRQIHAGRRRP